MSPEKQRIAIAEACGWKVEKLWNRELHGKPIGEQGPFREVPDYLNDRNAMHEALMTLTARQGNFLCVYLNIMGINGDWDIVTAPLELLAEALLRTIDKWEETE
jgi:hypothetical protein